MKILNKEEVKKAKIIINEELDKNGKIVDVIEDCSNDRFLHLLAKEFYDNEDSLEKADDVFSDILTLMEEFQIEEINSSTDDITINYTRKQS